MNKISELSLFGAAILLSGCAAARSAEDHVADPSTGCAMPSTASKSGSWSVGTPSYHAELWQTDAGGDFVVCISDDDGREVARTMISIPDGEVFETYYCTIGGVRDARVFALGKAGEGGAFAPRRAWRFDSASRSLTELDVASVRCVYSD